MPKSLYICYFGVREPLVQTQVIPYLLEIAKDDIEITLLTFEPDLRTKWTTEQIAEKRAELVAKGIGWRCLAYHKRPSVPATAYDVFNGAWYIAKLLRTEKFDILHCRVHIPMLMGAIARKLSKHKPKLLFDIRGFFPEEYTDAGVWPENGWLYRSAKRVERWLMDEADGFVVLTEKARKILFPESKETGRDEFGRPVEVIPCCVDFMGRFLGVDKGTEEKILQRLGASGRFVVTHLGALGGLYLDDEIVEFLAAIREAKPSVFALFLTQTDPVKITRLLRENGFEENDYFVGRVDPKEVEGYLNVSDLALSFVRAGYATASRSPTKIPEYLACGVPIVANRGVGDVDELIERNGVGILVDEFKSEAYLNALQKLESMGDIGDKCRETARCEFDLEKIGGGRYRQIYEVLLSN